MDNCKAKGGRLFEPRNSITNDEVARIAAGIVNQEWFIGIRTESSRPQKFFYLSGGPSTYLPFGWWNLNDSFFGDEPNDYGGDEDCVNINRPGFVQGKWNDIKCYYQFRSICEMGDEIIG